MVIEDIALQMTAGIGTKGAVHLLEHFGSAQRIFAASLDELVESARLRPDVAHNIVARKSFAAAEKEFAFCRRHDIIPIASTDPEYPTLLREIPDYPAVIYLQGDPSVLSKRTLSMVGTRDATPYGLHMCNALVGRLAEQVSDLCIVSGLAFGIDIASHRAALEADCLTVAVLPCSLPNIVPTQHTAVAREILARGGALVAEFHSQTPQKGAGYLARNRIIAALSAGCVIVESPAVSGSLTTAKYADGYHRTVMAVSGRATDRFSAGTNGLIRNRQAQMVLSAEDIMHEMMWDLDPAPAKRNSAPATSQLTAEDAKLLGCFTHNDPFSVEELSAASGLNMGELAVLLIGLELSGAIRQLPGNQYMRIIELV